MVLEYLATWIWIYNRRRRAHKYAVGIRNLTVSGMIMLGTPFKPHAPSLYIYIYICDVLHTYDYITTPTERAMNSISYPPQILDEWKS